MGTALPHKADGVGHRRIAAHMDRSPVSGGAARAAPHHPTYLEWMWQQLPHSRSMCRRPAVSPAPGEPIGSLCYTLVCVIVAGCAWPRPWVPLRGRRHRSARHGDVGAAPSPNTWSTARASPKSLQCLLIGASGPAASSSRHNHAKRARCSWIHVTAKIPATRGQAACRCTIFLVHLIGTDTVRGRIASASVALSRGWSRLWITDRSREPTLDSALYERRP
jgi:hypothetical protein